MSHGAALSQVSGCDAVVRASRRAALKVGCASAFGLPLSGLLRARAFEANGATFDPGFGRAKSCIVLFCWGGMSQLEGWDPKPDAPAEVRGEYKAIDTTIPGVQVGEYLPLLARQTERLAIVRSCRHRARDHRQAAYWTLTGIPPIQLDGVMVSNPVLPTRHDKPSLGSTVGWLRGMNSALPASVTLPYPIAERGLVGGQNAGYLGVRHDPLFARPTTGEPFPGVSPLSEAPDLTAIDDAVSRRLQSRGELLRTLESTPAVGGRPYDSTAWDHFHEYAADMLTSPQVQRAFRLDQEPERLHEAYGKHIFGQSVLLARRLTEAGVPLVTVNCGAGDLNGGIGAIWDTHFVAFPQLKNHLMPPFDRAASALLDDLAERGTLDETLVLFLTEFGRQPLINQFAGRDHLPDCYSVAFAGGGIRGGQVLGRSDRLAAEVLDGACGPADLHATVFHALGIDGQMTLTSPAGERVPLTDGKPLPLCR
jgi:hypothetical protein